MTRHEYAVIDFDECVTATAAAILLRIDERKVWIPVSLIEEPPEIGDLDSSVLVAQWFAEKEGLV